MKKTSLKIFGILAAITIHAQTPPQNSYVQGSWESYWWATLGYGSTNEGAFFDLSGTKTNVQAMLETNVPANAAHATTADSATSVTGTQSNIISTAVTNDSNGHVSISTAGGYTALSVTANAINPVLPIQEWKVNGVQIGAINQSAGFIGNGSGLSNLPAAQLTGQAPATALPNEAMRTNGSPNLVTGTGANSGVNSASVVTNDAVVNTFIAAPTNHVRPRKGANQRFSWHHRRRWLSQQFGGHLAALFLAGWYFWNKPDIVQRNTLDGVESSNEWNLD